jgi:hypothetical protein
LISLSNTTHHSPQAQFPIFNEGVGEGECFRKGECEDFNEKEGESKDKNNGFPKSEGEGENKKKCFSKGFDD